MGVNASIDDRNVLGLLQAGFTEYFEGSWSRALSLYNGASDRGTETYGILGANPAMREWIGARQAGSIGNKSYDIRNKKYESTLIVGEDELNRDKLGMLQARVGTFAADASAGHWEGLIEDLIVANGICYDSQNYFDTDHLWEDSGTQTNEVTATECPSLNVGTTTAPTPVEMANIILEMTAYLCGYKNNKGRPMNGNARAFKIACSTAQIYSAATQAITSGLVSSSGPIDNPLIGMRNAGFSYQALYLPRLTSATTKVRIFRADGPVKPFIQQEERGVRFEMLGQGSDFWFENHAMKIGVDASRGVGYGEPLYAISGTMS